MQRPSCRVGLALVLVALTAGGGVRAQPAGPPLPPLPLRILKPLHDDPQAWQAFRARHASVPKAIANAALPAADATTPAHWVVGPQAEGEPLSNPLLLTDGTVIAHVSCSGVWFRLRPDINGSYTAGTWSQIAAMPSGYAPRFFASGVLADGRVIVEGGEYNDSNCDEVETNRGAIYDPVKNTWTKVNPPKGWGNIGDASSVVLPDGRFMMTNACNQDSFCAGLTNRMAVLNPTNLTWTTTTPAGKSDGNSEENWTLLPNGDVLTVEAYTDAACSDGAALFVPAAAPQIGAWTSAGTTLHKLSGCSGSIQAFEAPTQILRPNGTVVAFGSTASTPSQNSPVYTAIYNTATHAWTAGPSMPKLGGVYYTMADAPAAVLHDGTALIAASPGTWPTDSNLWYPAPTHVFTFNGSSFAQLGDLANASAMSSYEANFLVLPTDQILAVETDFSDVGILVGVGNGAASWAPVIATLSSTTLAPGGTYALTGTQLSGLTQGASYGDDAQADTNFPLVRIRNNATGHVFYARTFGFTSRSVAPGTKSSTQFVVNKATEKGASTLVVVANGNASAPRSVTIE